VLVDLPTDIKQKYAVKKKRNKTLEGTKKQPEKQDKPYVTSILFYFILFYIFLVSIVQRQVT